MEPVSHKRHYDDDDKDTIVNEIFIPVSAPIDWSVMKDRARLNAKRYGETTIFHSHAYGTSCNMDDGKHETILPELPETD
jgi:hypothetical protein